ncbi:MAG TPA: DUF2085 domain-containing protein [Vicinamibacterales bacterium]
MTRTAIRPILVAAPIVWIAAVFGALVIASQTSVGVALYALSAAVYETGSLVCHQLSNRSFHVWGAQMPVCARCTGLYVGAAAAAALTATRIDRAVQRQVWDRARELLLIGATPTALTLAYEWLSGVTPGNWIRAAAGFPLGAIVMLIVVAATASESVVEIH